MKIDDCQLFLILVREVNHATAIQIQQRPVEYRNAPGIFILEQCLFIDNKPVVYTTSLPQYLIELHLLKQIHLYHKQYPCLMNKELNYHEGT